MGRLPVRTPPINVADTIAAPAVAKTAAAAAQGLPLADPASAAVPAVFENQWARGPPRCELPTVYTVPVEVVPAAPAPDLVYEEEQLVQERQEQVLVQRKVAAQQDTEQEIPTLEMSEPAHQSVPAPVEQAPTPEPQTPLVQAHYIQPDDVQNATPIVTMATAGLSLDHTPIEPHQAGFNYQGNMQQDVLSANVYGTGYGYSPTLATDYSSNNFPQNNGTQIQMQHLMQQMQMQHLMQQQAAGGLDVTGAAPSNATFDSTDANQQNLLMQQNYMMAVASSVNGMSGYGGQQGYFGAYNNMAAMYSGYGGIPAYNNMAATPMGFGGGIPNTMPNTNMSSTGGNLQGSPCYNQNGPKHGSNSYNKKQNNNHGSNYGYTANGSYFSATQPSGGFHGSMQHGGSKAPEVQSGNGNMYSNINASMQQSVGYGMNNMLNEHARYGQHQQPHQRQQNQQQQRPSFGGNVGASPSMHSSRYEMYDSKNEVNWASN